MGKIHVNGSAFKVVPHDRMKLIMSLMAKGQNLKTINQANEKQVARLVQALEELGIGLDRLQVQATSIGKHWNNNLEELIETRSFIFESDLDIPLLNRLNHLFSQAVTDGNFQTEFSVGEPEAIKQSLIRDAIADSRAKAELIAQSVDQNLGRAVDVNLDSNQGPIHMPRMETYAAFDSASAKFSSSADQASPSETRFEQSVNVTWEMD